MTVHWTQFASLLDGLDELLEQLPAGVERAELWQRSIELRTRLYADVRAVHAQKYVEMKFHNLEMRGSC
jgi:hypothetical protein